MDDDGDLREQVLHVEAQIEELADVIESCLKIIIISKAAIAAGGILILAIIIGAAAFDPAVMIGAIAAAIGGTVTLGSNRSTLFPQFAVGTGYVACLHREGVNSRFVASSRLAAL